MFHVKRSTAGRAVLFANGDLTDVAYLRTQLRDDDMLVAVNGGSRLLWKLQRLPDLLIGDSDSLPLELQRWLEAGQVPRHLHPAEKDETDLELAFKHVVSEGIRELLFIGLTGRRADHMLANFSLLALAQPAGVEAEAIVGREHLYLVYDQLVLTGVPGQTVSLLPWGGAAVGVHTKGLKWELTGEMLPFGPARGISNLMRDEKVLITVTSGMLIVARQAMPLAEPDSELSTRPQRVSTVGK